MKFLSVKDVDAMTIPGYKRVASECHTARFGVLDGMRFGFVVYQNNFNHNEVMVEVKWRKDGKDNKWNGIDLDEFKSFVRSFNKDDFDDVLSNIVERDGGRWLVAGIRDLPFFKMSYDGIYYTKLVHAMVSNIVLFQAKMCFPDKVKTFDDGIKVDRCCARIEKLRDEIDKDGNPNPNGTHNYYIKTWNEKITNAQRHIANVEQASRENQEKYLACVEVFKKYGIDGEILKSN